MGVHIKRWSDEEKLKAREMRRQGNSFKKIKDALGVSKSTLSLWVRDIPKPANLYFTNSREWLAQIRVLAAVANKKKRQEAHEEIIDQVKKDVATWKLIKEPEVKKTLLAILYWAEGAKGRQVVTFANTDPHLAFLFITLLRNSFEIDESKLRVRLHLHYYHKEKDVKHFWSQLLRVPENQFGKTYRKYRSKERTFRRNYGGICFIKYNSLYLQKRIMRYAYEIADILIGKINVPVA